MNTDSIRVTATVHAFE